MTTKETREDQDEASIDELLQRKVMRRILSDEQPSRKKEDVDPLDRMERMATIKMMMNMFDGSSGAKQQVDPTFDYMMKIQMVKGMNGGDSKMMELLITQMMSQREKDIGNAMSKNDPVMEMLREQLKDSRASVDRLSDNFSKMRDEHQQKTLEHLEDTITAQQEQIQALATKPVDTRVSMQDTLTEEVTKLVLEKNKNDLQRLFGIDLNKPAGQQSAGDIDKINSVVKSIGDTISQGIEAYGKARGAMAAPIPPQDFQPAQQRPGVTAQILTPPAKQPPEPQAPQNAPDVMEYVDENGNTLSKEDTEKLIKEGKLKILRYEEAPDHVDTEQHKPDTVEG